MLRPPVPTTSVASSTRPDPVRPRIGGLEGPPGDRDAWTGGSNLHPLQSPPSVKAIRPSQFKFKKGSQESCEKGIRESDHLSRANDAGTKDKPAITLTSWLTTIDKHLVSTGMDTVFRILVYKDGSYQERYLLKEWGSLSKSDVQTWVRELQETGVRSSRGVSPDTPTSGESTISRLPVCHYDKQNLEMSANFLRESIKSDLWTKIERSLPEKATGPELLYRIIHEHQAQGATVLRNLEDTLRKLKLSQEPGEDVISHSNKVTEVARRIVGSGSPPKDLNLLVANTFLDSTTKQFELEALRIVNEIDRDSDSYDWYKVIDELTVKYESLLQRKQWVAHQTKKEDPVTALKAEVKQLKRTMQNGKGTDKETRTCYHCNEKGHIAPNCPKKKSADKSLAGGSNGNGGGSGGFNSQKKTDGPKGDVGHPNKKKKADRIPPKEGEPEIKTVDGSEWAWCGKCKRWTKGPKKHGTDEHKTKEQLAANPVGQLASTNSAPSGIRLVGGLFYASVGRHWCTTCNAHVTHSQGDCPNEPSDLPTGGPTFLNPTRYMCRHCHKYVMHREADCPIFRKKRKCLLLQELMLRHCTEATRRRIESSCHETGYFVLDSVLKA